MKNGGGHFALELGGHFELESGGHFKLEFARKPYFHNCATSSELETITQKLLMVLKQKF